MKYLFAALCVVVSLTGCSNSNEAKAQAIVDEVRALWDSGMPFAPGQRQTRTLKMSKEFVMGCAANMSEAIVKLSALKKEYADTKVAKSEETSKLNTDVFRWASTCSEIKNKQGW
jgi:uncharacterized lipoprotein NlpE involved in copper resistance